MTGWTLHDGLAVALPVEGIDTDQLIPARFMSAQRADGYGKYLLHDQRFDANGAPADHPLNAPEAHTASILIAKRNFGGGSSREAAVYALSDYGIRAVIAPSFGDIFAGNAVNNGLLPARVSDADSAAILAVLAAPRRVRIDLETQLITIGTQSWRFDLDPGWRQKLINGWDDIDLTASYTAEIAAFRDADRQDRRWAWLTDSQG
jgi:3-isopropylmalate/(R)-2-methylmalate dehydratase small subunit